MMNEVCKSRFYLIVTILVVLICVMTGCKSMENSLSSDDKETKSIASVSADVSEQNDNQIEDEAGSSDTPNNTESSEPEKSDDMRIIVTDGKNEIEFVLNDSSPSKSFYDMLPITVNVDNYSSNEKIFHAALDTSSTVGGAAPSGSIAYFSPWENVCMYYGDAPAYSGLYIMGEAIKGADNIARLSGTITINKVDM